MASSTTRDYYTVLGVPKTATDKDIRSAYRRLARKYHPDLNPGDRTAETRFKELQSAYDVLSDPMKRPKYDRFGPNWEQVERGQAGFAGGFNRESRTGTRGDFADLGDSGDTNDLFESIFGGLGNLGRTGARARPGTRTRARVGEDIEQPVELSLEEAFHGASRTIESPALSGPPRRIEAKIPAGVRTGAKVRLAGEGAAGFGGGSRGDLFLVISVRPHGIFERKDDELICEVSMPLITAILGGEVQVPTIKGGKVALKIPAETQNGQIFRLGGLGMPKATTGQGDLFAKMKVVLPTKLSPRERGLFEEIQRERPA
jgi:curved DNA-binding protein